MLLRMVNIRHPAASAARGMLWQTQRCYCMHEPMLQSADVASMGWDGTWMGGLAVWLSERDISVLGGGGLPRRYAAGACLVDMTTLHKKMLSEGCCEVAAWRCSDMLRHDGRVRVDLVSYGGWSPEVWKQVAVRCHRAG